MKIESLLKILEKVAPVALSDEFCKKFDMYDNSGIIINGGGDIKGVLFALDLSEKAVLKAIKLGCNAIVTHHPAIYYGVKKFDVVNDGQARALSECIKKGISVISMHLNFDAAPRGIDYWLMRGVGGERAEIAANLSSGGYGRVYSIKEQTLGELAGKIRKEFNSKRVLVYGNEEKIIKKAASFCGAGCDEFNMAFAKNQGADVFISSDMKHHEIAGLLQNELSVIVLTHYSSENYGFNKIFENIKGELGIQAEYFCDKEML